MLLRGESQTAVVLDLQRIGSAQLGASELVEGGQINLFHLSLVHIAGISLTRCLKLDLCLSKSWLLDP